MAILVGSKDGRDVTSVGGPDNPAVAHPDDAVAAIANALVVGDKHKCQAGRLVELAQQVDDLGAVLESSDPVGSSAQTIAGHDERPGDRDALTLAAGELGRPVRCPLFESDFGERGIACSGPHPAGDRDEEWQLDVFDRAQTGSRLKTWKTNPMRQGR